MIMITIISSVLGFAGAMVPDLLSIWKDRTDRQHELEIMNMQLEQQKNGHQQRLEEIHIQADIAETQAIYKTYHSNIEWVDALNASVRPVLAYAFFLLYAMVKYSQAVMLDTGVLSLWGEEDQSIFAGIISFYFGQRAFGKLQKK